MTGSQRDAEASRGRAPAVVWNVVVPALGLALIPGAPILPALVIAAASVVLQALLAPRPQRAVWRHWITKHRAPRRVPHGG
jgi:hypothetical protein